MLISTHWWILAPMMLDLAAPEESSRARHANAGKESGVNPGVWNYAAILCRRQH